jgi:hypothetical protein
MVKDQVRVLSSLSGAQEGAGMLHTDVPGAIGPCMRTAISGDSDDDGDSDYDGDDNMCVCTVHACVGEQRVSALCEQCQLVGHLLCVCVCESVYVYLYLYVNVYVYVYVYVFVYVYVYVYVYMYVFVYVYVYVCVCACVRVCVCVCVCVCVPGCPSRRCGRPARTHAGTSAMVLR